MKRFIKTCNRNGTCTDRWIYINPEHVALWVITKDNEVDAYLIGEPNLPIQTTLHPATVDGLTQEGLT